MRKIRLEEKIELSRIEKILIVMYELSGGERKHIKFEDLVVALFKKYPKHFHLKGYPRFPDSEAVNNALYHNLKKKGVIDYGNKVFTLTGRGLTTAERLEGLVKGKTIDSMVRLPNHITKEIQRIKSLDGFKLFLKQNDDRILDTDFYNYLAVSVRTEKGAFLGRLETIEEVINELKKRQKEEPLYQKIVAYHRFMCRRFQEIVNYYKSSSM